MNLEKLSSQLSGEAGKIPPVQEWNPPYCGEMDLTIKKDGNWLMVVLGLRWINQPKEMSPPPP